MVDLNYLKVLPCRCHVSQDNENPGRNKQTETNSVPHKFWHAKVRSYRPQHPRVLLHCLQKSEPNLSRVKEKMIIVHY